MLFIDYLRIVFCLLCYCEWSFLNSQYPPVCLSGEKKAENLMVLVVKNGSKIYKFKKICVRECKKESLVLRAPVGSQVEGMRELGKSFHFCNIC